MGETIVVILVALAVVYGVILLFVEVGNMAKRRGQSGGVWIVAALFLNPIVAMVLLWMFCDVLEDHK